MMRRLLAIALKDMQVIFRDRAALILMLAAPLVLTLGLGFVTGAFNRDDSDQGIRDIPLVVVNQDAGELGQTLLDVFASDEVAPLFALTQLDDPAAARAAVDAETAAAAVIVPAGFSAGMLPDAQTGATGEVAPIELYSSPTAPISAGVVDAVVSTFVTRVETGIVAGQLSVAQLIASGRVSPLEMLTVGPEIGAQLAAQPAATQVTLNRISDGGGEATAFNALAFIAPGMALLFLMYTVSLGGRDILQERAQGTWQRVLTTPTRPTELVGGKVFGTFLSAVVQLAILIGVSTLLFGLRWGDAGAIALLVVSAALAATGWGMLFAAVSRTAQQVSGIGSATMLLFGLLSGAFVPVGSGLINYASRITPNRWALDAFFELGSGGALRDVLPNIGALWLMALLLFGVSIVLFQRRAA